MILTNFYQFTQTQDYLKLEAPTLIKYLSSSGLKVTSEYKLFQCLDKWFRYNPNRLMKDGIAVLSHIRYGLMSERELSLVKDSDVMSRCLGALHLVTKGFKYHLDCREGHPVIEEVSTIRTETTSLVLVHPHSGSSYAPFQITSHDHTTGMFYRLFTDVNGSRDCRLSVIDDFGVHLQSCRFWRWLTNELALSI